MPWQFPLTYRRLKWGGLDPNFVATGQLTVGEGTNILGFADGSYGSLSSATAANTTISDLRVSNGGIVEMSFSGSAAPLATDGTFSVEFNGDTGGPYTLAWNGFSSDYRVSAGAPGIALYNYLNSKKGQQVGVAVTENWPYQLTIGEYHTGGDFAGFASSVPFGSISAATWNGATFNRYYAHDVTRFRVSFVSNARPNSATTLAINLEGDSTTGIFTCTWDGFAQFDQEDNTIASNLYDFLIARVGQTIGTSIRQTS